MSNGNKCLPRQPIVSVILGLHRVVQKHYD